MLNAIISPKSDVSDVFFEENYCMTQLSEVICGVLNFMLVAGGEAVGEGGKLEGDVGVCLFVEGLLVKELGL